MSPVSIAARVRAFDLVVVGRCELRALLVREVAGPHAGVLHDACVDLPLQLRERGLLVRAVGQRLDRRQASPSRRRGKLAGPVVSLGS
jgi:hypothetical protein